MGNIYFIAPEAVLMRPHDCELAMVKIGFTADLPQRRLDQLQAGSPCALSLLFFVRGSQAAEQALHETYCDLRSHREWFFVSGALRSMLEKMEHAIEATEHDRERPFNAGTFLQFVHEFSGPYQGIDCALEVAR